MDKKLKCEKSAIPVTKARIVVKMIPIKIAPLDLLNIRMMVTTRPAKATNTEILLKFTSAGKIPPEVTTLVTGSVKLAAGSPPLMDRILLASEVNCKSPAFLIPR